MQAGGEILSTQFFPAAKHGQEELQSREDVL